MSGQVTLSREEYEKLITALERAVRVAESWRAYALRLERQLRRMRRGGSGGESK